MNWKDFARAIWDGEGRRLALPIDILHTNIIAQTSRSWKITPTIDISTAKRYQLNAGHKQAELLLKQVTNGVVDITLVPPVGSVASDESDLVDLIAGALWRSEEYHNIRQQKAQSSPTTKQVAIERFYSATKEAIEKDVRDFARSWQGKGIDNPTVSWESANQLAIGVDYNFGGGLHFDDVPLVKIEVTPHNSERIKVRAWAMGESTLLTSPRYGDGARQFLEFAQKTLNALIEYLDLATGWQAVPGTASTNQVGEGQTGSIVRNILGQKRIFGLRVDYLIAGILISIVIFICSLFFFPEWSRSNLFLLVLFFIAFNVTTNFIANFRKAYE